jgi:hypothetical protein
MAPIRKDATSALGEVKIEPKRVVDLPRAAAVGSDLPEGAALAKEIVNTQLRAVRDRIKHHSIDSETVRNLRDMTAVYETLAGIERKERAADSLGDKLANMTDEQLDELDRELGRKKR